VIAGIGQGYWAVTPLQLAHAVATLAGGGVPYLPRLGMATSTVGEAQRQPLPNPPGATLIRQRGDWAVINAGMRAVITEGTGKGLNDGFPYAIAGKSGTAERYSRTSDAYDTNRNTAYLATRHRAWFIAYAPADHPQIAVAVVLEQGAWGASAAGPIVRKILDAWLATHQGVLPGAERLPDAAPLPSAAPAPAGSVVEDVPVSASSEVQP